MTGKAVVAHIQPFVHPDYPFLSGHIDRFILPPSTALFNSAGVLNTSALLECKTANPFAKDEWGEVGSDEVPMGYLVQCAWYMMLTGCTQADLAVLFSNADFRIYSIAKDPELENLLLNKAVEFWHTHVLANVAPPPSNELDCKLLYRQSKESKSVEVSPSALYLIQELPALATQVLECEERISQIKQAVMQELQDADTLRWNGNILATWKAPKPSFKLDAKTLMQDHPELATRYQMPIAISRRLVIKEGLLTQDAAL
jgi:predicted phage-related endonuclease